jgi:hypothetical protein
MADIEKHFAGMSLAMFKEACSAEAREGSLQLTVRYPGGSKRFNVEHAPTEEAAIDVLHKTLCINVNPDPMDERPDQRDVDRLEDVMTADDFPAGWLTMSQIEDALEDMGFWNGTELEMLSYSGRRDWLAKVFDGCRDSNMVRLWPHENGDGERLKHQSRLTTEAEWAAQQAYAERRIKELEAEQGEQGGER